MKFKRQNMILKLIGEYPVETQKELADKLNEAGISATQATVSRDIKELNLIKIHDHDEHYKYATSKNETAGAYSNRLYNIFRESVVSIDSAGNIVVIKTLSGVASAAAAAIDSMKLPQILGSLAGDDTLLIVMRSQVKAVDFCQEVRNMLK